MSVDAAGAKRPHLSELLAPERIAIVGASRNPRSLAARYLDHLLRHRFPGELIPINRSASEVRGIPALPSLQAIDGPIGCALITVPDEAAIEAAITAAGLGVGVVVMFTSGFAETGEQGRARQAELTAAFRGSGSRLLGPNCPGFVNAAARIGASVSAFVGGHDIPSGGVGIVAQSGAVGGLIAERVLDRGAGLSQLVFTGNEADVELGEAIEAVAAQEGTRVVACFVEGLIDAERALAGIERTTASGTPVLVLSVGRSDVGRKAASLHTGKLLAVGEAERAALAQAGAVLVDELVDLAEVAVAVSTGARRGGGRRVGIVSTTGGLGALVADQVRESGRQLPSASQSVQTALSEVLPSYASTQNPCDLADALTTREDLLQHAVAAFAASGRYDALLLTMAVHPGWLAQALAEDLIDAAARCELPLAVVWPGGSMGTDAVAAARAGGVPVLEATRSCGPLLQAWEVIAGAAVRPRRTALEPLQLQGTTERELKLTLARAGLRAPESRLARSAQQAAEALSELGRAAVLKAHEPAVDHKAAYGLVQRGIADESSARRAFEEIEAAAARAGIELESVLVEEQEQGIGLELLVSCRRSPLGLELLLGPGGSTAELAGARAVRLAPLLRSDVEAMCAEVGVPESAREGLLTALEAVQRLALGCEDLDVLELNPVVLLPDGPVALDAKIRLGAGG